MAAKKEDLVGLSRFTSRGEFRSSPRRTRLTRCPRWRERCWLTPHATQSWSRGKFIPRVHARSVT